MFELIKFILSLLVVPEAHQQEPLSLLISTPFPSSFILRTALRGGFARTQFKDPIKTELDKQYTLSCSVLNSVPAKPPLRTVL